MYKICKRYQRYWHNPFNRMQLDASYVGCSCSNLDNVSVNIPLVTDASTIGVSVVMATSFSISALPTAARNDNAVIISYISPHQVNIITTSGQYHQETNYTDHG